MFSDESKFCILTLKTGESGAEEGNIVFMNVWLTRTPKVALVLLVGLFKNLLSFKILVQVRTVIG